MNLTNLFKIALRALANNKMRGFLTMLGIIIGVASVITMLAIGQGSKRSIQAEISEMGSNMIMIQPGGDIRGGVRQEASSMETLKLEDYQNIVDETRYVAAVSPSVNSSGQVIYGANNAPTTIYGISPDYMEIRRYQVEDGEMFSDQDIAVAAKVCVVGKTVVDNLFPGGENPVGKVIRFQKLPFKIVGVLESKGYNSMGMDQDDLILAPYTTIQKKVLNAWDFGVPQKRERLITVGIRNDLVGKVSFSFPKEHDYKPVLRDVLLDCPEGPGVPYGENKRKIFELVPPGGYWRDIDPEIAKAYMKSCWDMEGGRTGILRRMSLDEPSLTVLTSPSQKQTERCHPLEARPFTVRENARCQTFPDEWQFCGSVQSQYKQVGNAVPVNLAYEIGLEIHKSLEGVK